MATNSAGERGAVRHEKRDANLRAIAIFGGVLFLTIAGVLIGMRFLFFHFAKEQSLGTRETPFANARVLPPEPRLQPNPRRDLENYMAAQKHEFTTYGWVDRQNGVVRIPVKRAMRILLKQGFPVQRPAKPAGGSRESARAKVPRLSERNVPTRETVRK
ncbi:MAG TPA: hypothetical protein VNF00_06330 [Candidatus Acidoferrales bacterium]|nr:hypothetical protein [Candidatus Acidoferrales bacterium]